MGGDTIKERIEGMGEASLEDHIKGRVKSSLDRYEEVKQLTGLNSRLAILVDKVMRCELEKRRLTRYLETVTETVNIGTKDMEEVYKEQAETLKKKKVEEEEKLVEMLEKFGVIKKENDDLKRKKSQLDSELGNKIFLKDKLESDKHYLTVLVGDVEQEGPLERRRLNQAEEK